MNVAHHFFLVMIPLVSDFSLETGSRFETAREFEAGVLTRAFLDPPLCERRAGSWRSCRYDQRRMPTKWYDRSYTALRKCKSRRTRSAAFWGVSGVVEQQPPTCRLPWLPIG